MSFVAGVDYSTHAVDVVLVDEDTMHAAWHRYPLTGRDAFDRARTVTHAMPPGSFWDDTVAVGIEDPRGHNTGALYRIQGAVLACLPAGVLVQPWVPSEWRKAVGLPGNASKQTVVDWAEVQPPVWNSPQALFKLGGPDSNACDAYCVALATLHAIQRTEAA